MKIRKATLRHLLDSFCNGIMFAAGGLVLLFVVFILPGWMP